MPARARRKTSLASRGGLPRPVVVESINTDIDWTPPSLKLHPRIVTATGKTLMVEVQEASIKGEAACLYVGVWRGKKPIAGKDIFGDELAPAQLDELLSLLTIARDRAVSLGFTQRLATAGK